MEVNYGKTQSLWMGQDETPEFEALKEDLNADVCVIGSGISGLMSAYELALEGQSVVVLEAGAFCGGETSRTTAHLSFALDDRYYHLEHLFGETCAQMAYQSHAAAIDEIEKVAARHRIACEFTRLDGYLFAPSSQEQQELDRELAAALRAGVPVERLARTPLPGLDVGPCLRFSNQAQFNPLRFMRGVAAAFGALRGKIYTNSRVKKVNGGKRPSVETENHTVTADAVIVATNSPINENLTIHARQSPYRTYAIGASIPWGSIPRALYWDTLDPYHYVRLESAVDPSSQKKKNDVLIVGGEDHRQGEPTDNDAPFARLEQWTRERFPIVDVRDKWSGMVNEPADSLAFIGRDNTQENVYIVTGDSGHGMTHGTIAGMLLRDLVLQRKNPWESLYDPGRLTGKATTEYVRDAAGVVGNLASWVTPGEVSERDDIVPGSGAVIRHGLEKQAVYRDKHGAFFTCSAVCPHLGCIVSWNAVEDTWDCPCHGSRFDTHGKVIRGPATENLERAGER